jgi:hypothetical protein
MQQLVSRGEFTVINAARLLDSRRVFQKKSLDDIVHLVPWGTEFDVN